MRISRVKVLPNLLLKRPVVDLVFYVDKGISLTKELDRPFALHLFNAILTTVAPHGSLHSLPSGNISCK